MAVLRHRNDRMWNKSWVEKATDWLRLAEVDYYNSSTSTQKYARKTSALKFTLWKAPVVVYMMYSISVEDSHRHG